MPIRIIFLLILVLSSFPVGSQDCVNCGNGYDPAPRAPDQPWPLEYVTIYRPDYPRNSRATFCKRPPEMVDTIVLHHTATSSGASPQDINRMHLNEGTPGDPWYMVAYSYLINGAYPGANSPDNAVYEGRPLDIVGAHAGSNIFVPMDNNQRRLWAEGKITCGGENLPFSVNPSLVNGNTIKANVTTIGISVIGNYAPRSISNPLGYGRNSVRNPSSATLDNIARLSCQLQKKYPNMKTIKWHGQYHSTECPGTIKNFIGQIKARARGIGCEFN